MCRERKARPPESSNPNRWRFQGIGLPKEHVMSVRFARSALLAAAAAAALAGRVVAPVAPDPGYGYGYGYGGEVVAVAPPPLQAEYVGPPPVAGYIWLGGYWGWGGGRHVWYPGHWEAPRAGYH